MISSGCFMMGCSPSDEYCVQDEWPVHPVHVTGFEILETEVTDRQYEAIMGLIPSYSFWEYEGPAEYVTWYDASTFCSSIGGRLCTEAEWEYAARGGTTTRWYCGDDIACVDSIAWIESNSGNGKHAVKQKLPNAYGLYDMAGNVYEWVSDGHEFDYYCMGPDSQFDFWNPVYCDPDGHGWTDPWVDPTGFTSDNKGYRGGAYMHDATWARSSSRSRSAALVKFKHKGVRCCR